MVEAKTGRGGALRGPDGKFVARTADPATDATRTPKAKTTVKRGTAKKRKRSDEPLKPLELVQRVYAAIESELTKLEQQAGTSSQDRERGSRALSQIVNSLEKATDMQQVLAAKTAKGGTAKDKEALADAEDLRRQIAERLERLSRKRDAGK